MGTVSVRDLRNRGADVLGRVARGESLIVTRDGEPVASLSPLPRRLPSTEQLIARRRALPQLDVAALRADVDELLDSRL
ncbi:type II toxin-antitoxin system Phd/YefM family antitoxin [Georgenia yuyongxinii]